MKTAIVKGSLQNLANTQQKSLARLWIDVEMIVMLDVSSSMGIRDFGNKTRFARAVDELTMLQKKNPGKIALMLFSDRFEWCMGGVARFIGGSTDVAGALKFVRGVDDRFMKIVLVGDGEPDDEKSALSVAATLQGKISTVYVGPEDGRGRLFLKKLATRQGGTYHLNEFAAELSKTVSLMLEG